MNITKYSNICLIAMSLVLTSCSSQTELSQEKIESLAKNVKKDQVILYGSESCPYCRKAEAWLNDNNIAFTDCDLDKSDQCAKEYGEFEASGIPFFVIKGDGDQYETVSGFDIEGLLSAIEKHAQL